jgi:hypothetical protein
MVVVFSWAQASSSHGITYTAALAVVPALKAKKAGSSLVAILGTSVSLANMYVTGQCLFFLPDQGTPGASPCRNLP